MKEQRFKWLIQSGLQRFEKLLCLVRVNGLINSVFPHFFAAEGGEEGTAAEGEAEVAGEGADVGAFAAVDTEVGLGQVRGHLAEGVLIEV